MAGDDHQPGAIVQARPARPYGLPQPAPHAVAYHRGPDPARGHESDPGYPARFGIPEYAKDDIASRKRAATLLDASKFRGVRQPGETGKTQPGLPIS